MHSFSLRLFLSDIHHSFTKSDQSNYFTFTCCYVMPEVSCCSQVHGMTCTQQTPHQIPVALVGKRKVQTSSLIDQHFPDSNIYYSRQEPQISVYKPSLQCNNCMKLVVNLFNLHLCFLISEKVKIAIVKSQLQTEDAMLAEMGMK